LVKCIILVFLGVLTIGIEYRCILQVGYQPHLSDKSRCSEASRFSITKIWYSYEYVADTFGIVMMCFCFFCTEQKSAKA